MNKVLRPEKFKWSTNSKQNKFNKIQRLAGAFVARAEKTGGEIKLASKRNHDEHKTNKPAKVLT